VLSVALHELQGLREEQLPPRLQDWAWRQAQKLEEKLLRVL